MFEIEKDLCRNAQLKAGLLIGKACAIGMDITGYGVVGENKSNGNVYLWLEDELFSLYIDLGSDEIKALWTNYNDGEEEIISADGVEYDILYDWANDLQEKANAQEEQSA